MEKILVLIGDGKIARLGETLVSYALGSCVGICLYDKEKNLAGMVHAILPQSPKAEEVATEAKYRYVDQGISCLIAEMQAHGARKSQLTAKLVGGAHMFQTINYEWDIGDKNIKMAKKILRANKIPLLAEDTGRDYGRNVFFNAEDGKVRVEAAKHALVIL